MTGRWRVSMRSSLLYSRILIATRPISVVQWRGWSRRRFWSSKSQAISTNSGRPWKPLDWNGLASGMSMISKQMKIFFEKSKKGEKTDKPVKGRVFLSFGNETGMRELLSLWGDWKNRHALPHGKTKWHNVFNQTLQIRRWGMEETLRETGMLDRWLRELDDSIIPGQPIHCQIELVYRGSPAKRKNNEG